MFRQAIIFDIDGTIADLTHRLHLVQGSARNWDLFFDLMHLDAPVQPVIDLANAVHDAATYSVLVVSARPDSHRLQTLEWMREHMMPCMKLYMRKAGDTRKDSIVKMEILEQIKADGYNPVMAIDDRKQVIDAWRRAGILTLACKPEEGDSVTLPERNPTLHLVIGPSGAGKSTWILNEYTKCAIAYSSIVSTDDLRAQFCGDFKDQTRNVEVFKAYHAMIQTRLWNGLDTYADATHIRRKDRLAVAELCPPNGQIIYHIFNRPMQDKRTTGGWRNDVGFDLMAKHEETFRAQLPDILHGDDLHNVAVIDHRVKAHAY